MKTSTNYLAKFLPSSLLFAFVLGAPGVYAQNHQAGKPEKGTIHMRLEGELNGKRISIDTTYSKDQQQAMEAYLKNLGLEMSSPPEPPQPPSPPDAMPAPPAPPEAPANPKIKKHDIVIHLNNIPMMKEEQEALRQEMEKLEEEISKLDIPELPEISIKEEEIIEKTLKQVEQEMQQLREQMQELNDHKEDLKNDWNDSDSKDKKEKVESIHLNRSHGFNFQSDNGLSPCSFKISVDSLNGNHVLFLTTNAGSESGETGVLTKTITLVSDGDKSTGNHNDKHQVVVVNRKKKKIFEEEEKNNAQPTFSEQRAPKNAYELQPGKFNIFPNPGEGIFNLEFTLKSNDPIQIKIMDSVGKLVYEENMEAFNGTYQKQIDIGKEGKGIYLLSITQDNQWMHKKLVVK